MYNIKLNLKSTHHICKFTFNRVIRVKCTLNRHLRNTIIHLLINYIYVLTYSIKALVFPQYISIFDHLYLLKCNRLIEEEMTK